ncbi:MAG: hypothetical protein WB502_05645 [Thermoactinomyces sp.]
MGNFSSFFARKFRKEIIFLFAILVGAGFLGQQHQVYAGGGTFDIPEINDDFYQVKPAPTSPEEISITETSQEKDFFDKVGFFFLIYWD